MSYGWEVIANNISTPDFYQLVVPSHNFGKYKELSAKGVAKGCISHEAQKYLFFNSSTCKG
jgi:hypothetical protein